MGPTSCGMGMGGAGGVGNRAGCTTGGVSDTGSAGGTDWKLLPVVENPGVTVCIRLLSALASCWLRLLTSRSALRLEGPAQRRWYAWTSTDMVNEPVRCCCTVD